MGLKMLCFAYMSNIPLSAIPNILPLCSSSVIQIVQGKARGSTPKGFMLLHEHPSFQGLAKHKYSKDRNCGFQGQGRTKPHWPWGFSWTERSVVFPYLEELLRKLSL